MVDSNKIMEVMPIIYEKLIFNSSFLYNIGLLNGKLGIAIFFFHLAQKTDNKIFEEYACDLVDQMLISINQHIPLEYVDGLAGIGVGIEYLIKQKFIHADANEVLEDIDRAILHHTQHHLPSTLEMNTGITGFGRYYIERLLNRKNSTVETPEKNQLIQIIQKFSISNTNYRELLSVIHFFANVIPLEIASEQCYKNLNYATEQLEAKVYENLRLYIISIKIIQLLEIATTLIQASKTINCSFYSEKAHQFLQLYQPELRTNFKNESPSFKLKLSFLYHYLGTHFKNNSFLQLSEANLYDYLSQKKMYHVSMGLLEGYAGAGMYLLFLNGMPYDNYLDIIPCYVG